MYCQECQGGAEWRTSDFGEDRDLRERFMLSGLHSWAASLKKILVPGPGYLRLFECQSQTKASRLAIFLTGSLSHQAPNTHMSYVHGMSASII